MDEVLIHDRNKKISELDKKKKERQNSAVSEDERERAKRALYRNDFVQNEIVKRVELKDQMDDQKKRDEAKMIKQEKEEYLKLKKQIKE